MRGGCGGGGGGIGGQSVRANFKLWQRRHSGYRLQIFFVNSSVRGHFA